MADLLQAARVGATCDSVTTRPSPQERSDAPSRSALVGFYLEVERIAAKRLSIGSEAGREERGA